MLGSLVSSLSQRMIRLATTALMVSGAGLAGYSYYLDQYKAADPRANTAITFFQENATWFIVLGVVGVVVGFVINMVAMRGMQKRMLGGMGGMGAGMGGGMDPSMLQAMQAMQRGQPVASASAPPAPAVKVRCPSCKALETETAAFCSSCGKSLR